MGGDIDIQMTTDMELVRSILVEPDIWERAAEDGIDQDTWYPGYNSMTAWLLCIEDDDVIGVILLHTDTAVSLKMHPYLRKEHRQKGRVMMASFYKWLLENTELETVNKINTVIPEYQKKVINFAKKVGFHKEGVSRESCRKNGQLYGQQNMGITRKEIEEYLYVPIIIQKTA